MGPVGSVRAWPGLLAARCIAMAKPGEFHIDKMKSNGTNGIDLHQPSACDDRLA
jgi:hypothetical protein